MRRTSLDLPPDLWERVDRARGAVARQRWIRDAIEMRLDKLEPWLPTEAEPPTRPLATPPASSLGKPVQPRPAGTVPQLPPQRDPTPEPLRVLALGHEWLNVHGGKLCEYRGCNERKEAH